jgi:hypothetical protein
MDKMMDRWTQHLIYVGIEDRQADKQTKIQTNGKITSIKDKSTDKIYNYI